MSARGETRTNKTTGKIEFLNRGVNLSVGEPKDLFKGDAVIRVSDLKTLAEGAETYADFVAAIKAL